ncbi:MAG: efflux RND transporter periplasmic adaptor subunit, partial [Solirubrobacteraceae bacterium]
MPFRDREVLRAAALGIVLSAALACGSRDAAVDPPPLEVAVAKAEKAAIPIYLEHVGTTEAVKTVEVRARVRGILEKVLFKEGADVKEGDLLFVIEQAPYHAALTRAKADLQRAQATLERTQADFGRTSELTRKQVASQSDLDHARAARDEASAGVAGLSATVEQAELDLGYTEIRAPIPGRIGRILVTQGNLVGGSEETPLATIVQLDPIYIYFSPSEKERLDVLRLRKEGLYVQRDEIEVRAVLADGSEFPDLGKLDFVDNTVDPNAGTVRVRAVFPNPDKTLLPGQYAKLRVLVARDVPVLLVPEQAIVEDQGGSTVWVLKDDGTAER